MPPLQIWLASNFIIMQCFYFYTIWNAIPNICREGFTVT
jgi:hypothetical protein